MSAQNFFDTFRLLYFHKKNKKFRLIILIFSVYHSILSQATYVYSQIYFNKLITFPLSCCFYVPLELICDTTKGGMFYERNPYINF